MTASSSPGTVTSAADFVSPAEEGGAVGVFAVCHARDTPALVGLVGLAGPAGPAGDGPGDGEGTGAGHVGIVPPADAPGPLRLLATGALVAVVRDLPAAFCSADALRQRLADRTELEHYARSHHAVVCAAAERAAAVPLPLATFYFGDERARAALAADERRFLAALARVEGRAEWGVKVYAARREPEPPGASAASGAERPAPVAGATAAAAAGGGGGRAYLDRVRGRQHDREQRQDAALRAADAVDRTFREVAVAARRLRPHGAEITGRRAQLLNAAYLVARDRDGRVAAAIARLRAELRDTAEIELSGPWPAYSFAEAGGPDADH